MHCPLILIGRVLTNMHTNADSFVQIFAPLLLPPHHFETVVYGGSVRWGVLLGLDFAIVPVGASDDKKVVRFKIRDVTKLTISRAEHFTFADEESTQRTAKVVVVLEEAAMDRNSPASGGSSPLGRLFGSSVRKSSHDSSGSGSGSASGSGSPASTRTREETFYIGVDAHSRLYECLYATWMCMLTSKAYGWTRVEEKQKAKDKIKALYLDLCDEISAAQDLQDRVDLIGRTHIHTYTHANAHARTHTHTHTHAHTRHASTRRPHRPSCPMHGTR